MLQETFPLSWKCILNNKLTYNEVRLSTGKNDIKMLVNLLDIHNADELPIFEKEGSSRAIDRAVNKVSK